MLFGAVAGWLASLLGGLISGWMLYLGCLALAGLGGWVLARPMERNTLLAVAVLWLSAGYVYYLLRPPVETGLLAVGAGVSGYVTLGWVVVSLGVGALIGRAIARP